MAIPAVSTFAGATGNIFGPGLGTRGLNFSWGVNRLAAPASLYYFSCIKRVPFDA